MMCSRSLLSLLLGLLLPLELAASAARTVPGPGTGPLVGGWQPIEDLKDPHVREIAEFAVTEYNKQSKLDLKLKSVVKGETQVVAGTNYRLVVSVQNKAVAEKYEALVWERPWLHFRNLTSFKPAV
ncbi:Cystatin [Parasponia andersonii]|uniref:Cystatin n=1 Tax=Parasponia andersonii TaxID=3476 RepID=A0A2P5ACR9_PARAD|nr:Cystatin [Parasponia andersonii]